VLNGADRVPLYVQIAARLRAQIVSGQYQPGSKIPSEHELSARFDVGRPTVRQATLQLVQERVLERRHGSGTYVASPPPEIDLFSAGGTLASFRKSGLPMTSRLLGRVRRRAIPLDAGAPLAGRPALFVARTSSLGDEPVLLEEMYFDPEAFPGLDRLPLAGRSLSELARERYLLRPLSTEQRFSVLALDAERAKLLGLPAGSLVLCVERTLDFVGARRALFARLYCRTEKLAFSQRFRLDHQDAQAERPDIAEESKS
jgi:GntR family transcriptional regulator